MFSPTFVDVGIFIGTIGFFFVLFLLYSRTFPVIAQAEVKSILKLSGDRYKNMRAEHGDDVQMYTLPKQEPLPDFEKMIAGLEANEEVTDEGGNLAQTLVLNIGKATQDMADDLKRLTGVGPALEKKLNEVGVYTYNQIMNMTENEYLILDQLISKFPKAKTKFWSGEANILNNN
jgi:molybdopterin-containing oxidoreductase family membrane subunit